MAFIEYGGKRHVVPAGEMLVGTGADCHLRLMGPGIALRHAVLTTAPDQNVSIRKLAEGADVEVNGVKLGPLPQPLLHGDKITLAGIDLLFVDERKSGSTQYVSAVKLQDLVPSAGARKPAGPGKATAATGGRIVSLTDGREYQVIGGSLKFGRDASADVVVAGSQVSRRHAEIVVSPRGYILVDSSTNGTFVNGERVQNQRLLARADVIRLGEEEFRFYADAAAAAAAPAPAQPSQQPPMAQAASAPPAAPAPAPAQPSAPPAFAQPVGPSTPQAPMQAQRPAASAAPAPPAAPQPPAAPPPRPAAAAPPPPPAPPQPAPPPPVPPPPSQPQPATPAPPRPAAPGAPGAAQLVSTGYFPTGAKPGAPVSPRTGEDVGLTANPAPPSGRAGSPVPPAPPKPAPAAATPPAPAPAPQRSPQALAKFLVRSGSLKGQRLYVKVPVVNIGRAEYNDLVIPDDSVSSQHAKLTRREGVWVLTDVGSTNGTMVDGERISSDTPIAPGAFVRFGDIQLVFEPTDDDAGMEKGQGTRAISAIKLNDIKPPQGR